MRDMKTSKADVVIIGAGPAGLALANCFIGSSLKVRLLEKRPSKARTGRADGLKYLTLEIFDTFGVYDHVMSEACRHEEICHWSPDDLGKLRRESVVPDVVPGLDEPREVTLAQVKVEQHLEDNLARRTDIRVERGRIPTSLVIEEKDFDPHASGSLQLCVESVPKETNGTTYVNGESPDTQETIEAKFVVGCDGANSWTRKQMGVGVHLEGTDSVWGVIDIVPKTNFPDIRKACTIRSASAGSMMLEPREGRLVRFYVHLGNLSGDQGSGFDRSVHSPEKIANVAQKIIAPFTLEYNILEWWSAYAVKQQVANQMSKFSRIFLAGDAVHLHSPKAGQGMNASIQDAFNLGWKLRACLEKNCDPAILKTYELERLPVAHALINFDRAYVPLLSNGYAPDAAEDVSSTTSDHFKKAYVQALTESTGMLINYPPSPLVDSASSSKSYNHRLATNVTPGMRLRNVKVINQSDGVALRIQKLIVPDGKFRLLVFPGDVSQKAQADHLHQLGDDLTSLDSAWSDGTLLRSQLEIITIHAAKRVDVELLDLHEVFHPWNEEEGWDYWKVYADDSAWLEGQCNVYETLGIGAGGCMILLRPDGYVSLICRMGDIDTVGNFLGSFMGGSSILN